MVVQVSGVINGRSIELERDVGLPAGAEVRVRIEAPDLSLEERRRRVRALCGAWKGDDSLEAVFASVARDRQNRACRDVNLDGSS